MAESPFIYLLFKETPPADNELITSRLFLGAFTVKREALEWRDQLPFAKMKLYRCPNGVALDAGQNITDMMLVNE